MKKIQFICKFFNLSHKKKTLIIIFILSCVLQILALLQDRQAIQSQNNTTTQLTDDERIGELQALSNLKKAVEKHSGNFLGSRQQVRIED